MQTDFLDNHLFKRGAVSYNADDPIIKIDFYRSAMGRNLYEWDSIDYVAEGHMLISLKDFAIHQFNYKVYKPDLPDPLYSVKLQYKKNEGKMYLNYISFNNKFSSIKEPPLAPEQLVYNSRTNTFTVRFNKEIDTQTVRKKHFKVHYKKRQMKIIKVEVLDSDLVELHLNKLSFNKKNSQSISAQDLDVEITKITDTNGVEVYEPGEYVQVRQFRELFVNEVDKTPDVKHEGYFVNEWSPLSETTITKSEKAGNFWVNSPLKEEVAD